MQVLWILLVIDYVQNIMTVSLNTTYIEYVTDKEN